MRTGEKSIGFGGVNRSSTNLGKQTADKAKAKEQIRELASGNKVPFFEETLSYEELKNNTFVKFEINGRN